MQIPTPNMAPRRATITGTGLCAPGEPVPNAVFDEKYGMDIDVFLRESRNIYTRHFMADDQATSDLVVPAAEEALENARLQPEDLDLIIVSTDTPDYISPSTAAVVQHKLGAKNAGVFDVNTACSGFVTALDMAGKYVAADPSYGAILVVGAYGMSKFMDWDDYKRATLFADGAGAILVVGAYGMSKFMDWDDYKRATLFADGAGAVIVQPTDRPDRGMLTSTLYAEGAYHDYMGIYAGGTFEPATAEAIERGDTKLRFAKRIPPETNIVHWPRLVHEVLDPLGAEPDEVDHYFFTQINIGSINATLDELEVPHEKSHNVMDRFGYTGSACIPMALADAARKHKVKDGDLVCFVGSGGGMSMAAVTMIWSYDT